MSVRSITALILAAVLSGCGDDRHDERLRAAGPNPSLQKLLAVADVAAGERKFGPCSACHTITKGSPNRSGPNLYGVFGQAMGQHAPRFDYSGALQAAQGRWDAATLNAWIANPRSVVPGTKMAFPGIEDPLDRADLIVFLRSRSDQSAASR